MAPPSPQPPLFDVIRPAWLTFELAFMAIFVARMRQPPPSQSTLSLSLPLPPLDVSSRFIGQRTRVLPIFFDRERERGRGGKQRWWLYVCLFAAGVTFYTFDRFRPWNGSQLVSTRLNRKTRWCRPTAIPREFRFEDRRLAPSSLIRNVLEIV